MPNLKEDGYKNKMLSLILWVESRASLSLCAQGRELIGREQGAEDECGGVWEDLSNSWAV